MTKRHRQGWPCEPAKCKNPCCGSGVKPKGNIDGALFEAVRAAGGKVKSENATFKVGGKPLTVGDAARLARAGHDLGKTISLSVFPGFESRPTSVILLTRSKNGNCVFLSVDNKCQLHDTPSKPLMCRLFPARGKFDERGRLVGVHIPKENVEICGVSDEVANKHLKDNKFNLRQLSGRFEAEQNIDRDILVRFAKKIGRPIDNISFDDILRNSSTLVGLYEEAIKKKVPPDQHHLVRIESED